MQFMTVSQKLFVLEATVAEIESFLSPINIPKFTMI